MSWGIVFEFAIKALLGWICYTVGGALLLGIPLAIYLFASKNEEG